MPQKSEIIVGWGQYRNAVQQEFLTFEGKATKQWLGSGALTVPPELIRIIERTVAVDPACSLITRNDKPPYSKAEEIFAARGRVTPSSNMVVRYTEDTLIHWLI